MADCPLYGSLDGSEREVRLLNIRGFITHGIADGIMVSIKGGSKAMRLPPRPARCVYPVEQAAMGSQRVGVGSQVGLSSEKAVKLAIKVSKRCVDS